MSVLFIIILLVGSIVLGIFLLINSINVRNMLFQFKRCNVIVAGPKGTGKGLIFQYVIKKRKDFYYANINFSKNDCKPEREIITIKDISIEPNTFENFVNNDLVKVPHKFYDGKDFYVDDIGNFLPSYMDSKLYKLYPSLPSFYSLSRHLYSSNVHCNTQNIERGWKALREQADFFVQCKRTYKFFGFIITKVISYDSYESARNKLLPMKKRFMNKYSKAEYDLFRAQNGDIRKFYVIQRKKRIYYDTRAFEKIVLTGERRIYRKTWIPKLDLRFDLR